VGRDPRRSPHGRIFYRDPNVHRCYLPSADLLRDHFRQCVLRHVKGARETNSSQRRFDPDIDLGVGGFDLAAGSWWSGVEGKKQLEAELAGRLWGVASDTMTGSECEKGTEFEIFSFLSRFSLNSISYSFLITTPSHSIERVILKTLVSQVYRRWRRAGRPFATGPRRRTRQGEARGNVSTPERHCRNPLPDPSRSGDKIRGDTVMGRQNVRLAR
jgi:hypothetical protein